MQHNKNLHNHAATVRFKRYSRAGYAVYNSLHREVTIGALATYIADRSAKRTLCSLAVCALLIGGAAQAQTERQSGVRDLPELTVTVQTDTLFGNPEAVVVLTQSQIQNLPIRTVGDLVAMLPGVDLRSRGGNDVQGDLSMRGSTFDQMAVLIGGVNFTDAQTGHHNLDIPIDIALVQRVELLSAADLMARGVMGFAGGVNIVVSEEYRNHLAAYIAGGDHGQAKASLSATRTAGLWALTATASYNRSDGYIPNTDYRYGNIYLQATRHGNRNDWHLQLGGQSKAFGSQAFYSAKYPFQFEATRTLVASACNVHRFRRSRLETVLYGRLHRDRFELFREGYVEAPAWYQGPNHHLASSEGLRSRWLATCGPGNAIIGAELHRDGILSNNLGSPLAEPSGLYTNSATRYASTLFGGYAIRLGKLSAAAYMLGTANSQFGFNHGLAATLNYVPSQSWMVSATASRTHRLPSFTDLYYHSATQQSNPNLQPESAWTLEASATYTSRQLRVVTDAYFRDGHNIIDWLQTPGETVWWSANHTAVKAAGADIQAVWAPQWLPLQIGVAYSYCHIDKAAEGYISQYALDYLRHKAELYAAANPWPKLTLKVSATVRQREGQYTDVDGTVHSYAIPTLLNATAQYDFGTVGLFVEGYNLLNASYCDYGGVPQPGTSVMAGAKFSL
ncbi:MAG: TonB-dependent receptor [Bacteroidales bacterium]|nr:TonB-dependent receptor [Bacteroidales bacterium]